jgi:uncharacterized membrane protein
MVKRRIQHDPQKKIGTKLTLWIAIGGLIGLFLGFFIGILFGGMIYFMPILAILGAAIGGTTGSALIQQKSVPRRPHDDE